MTALGNWSGLKGAGGRERSSQDKQLQKCDANAKDKQKTTTNQKGTVGEASKKSTRRYTEMKIEWDIYMHEKQNSNESKPIEKNEHIHTTDS